MRRQAPLQNVLFNCAVNLEERIPADRAPWRFKRARWRRLWRAQIQEYLTAAIQNIKRMIKNLKRPIPGALQVAGQIRTRFQALILREINPTLGVSSWKRQGPGKNIKINIHNSYHIPLGNRLFSWLHIESSVRRG